MPYLCSSPGQNEVYCTVKCTHALTTKVYIFGAFILYYTFIFVDNCMHKALVLARSEELITAELTNGGSGPIWDALVNNVQCGLD